MDNFYVYKHTSPSGKVYIGITNNIQRRWEHNGIHYISKKKNGKYIHPIFAQAILKYGWKNFTHEIMLEDLSRSEACYAEKYLIRWYKIHHQSYNCTDGGDGTWGLRVPISEERRKAVTEFMRTNHPMKGRHHTFESRKKMSKSLKGRKLSDTHILHISESLKGREISEEQKNKMSNYMKLHPERWASGKQRQEVHQYSLEGRYIASYPSAYDAAINISGKNNAGCIRSCIYGESTSALGYIWSYEKVNNIDNPVEHRKKRTNLKKGVNQYSKEGKYLNTFCSIAEASRKTGVPARNISRCCDPDIRLFTAGNYLWEYDTFTNRINKKAA